MSSLACTGWEHVRDVNREQASIVTRPGVDGQFVSDGSVGESSLVELARRICGFWSHGEAGLREMRFVEVHRVVVAARG